VYVQLSVQHVVHAITVSLCHTYYMYSCMLRQCTAYWRHAAMPSISTHCFGSHIHMCSIHLLAKSITESVVRSLTTESSILCHVCGFCVFETSHINNQCSTAHSSWCRYIWEVHTCSHDTHTDTTSIWGQHVYTSLQSTPDHLWIWPVQPAHITSCWKKMCAWNMPGIQNG